MELSWPSVLGRRQIQIPGWALLTWALSWVRTQHRPAPQRFPGPPRLSTLCAGWEVAQMCPDGTGLLALSQDLSPIHWEMWLIRDKHTHVEGHSVVTRESDLGNPKFLYPWGFSTLESKYQGFWCYQGSLLPTLRSNVIWKSYSHLPQVPCKAAVTSRMLWKSVQVSCVHSGNPPGISHISAVWFNPPKLF